MSTALQIRDLSPMAYALTRIGAKLMGAQTNSIFSPGQALQPVPADNPQAGPRQYQYPVAVNLNRLPRRDFSLTPFEMLRQLCQQHPVAALCIRVRTEQVADIAGTVIARRKKEQGALQRDCDDLDALFMMPDGQTPRSAWLKMLVRDLMEIDAPTVYKRPRMDGGIASLEVVDGATIKPVIDLAGRTAGYQQILYGLALSQYLERPARPGEEWLVGEYSPGELWYQPYWATTTSPYGKPPMEDMIRLAEIAISKQKFDLAHFTDGNIPAALAVFDEKAGMNPDQVFSFEQDFNADMQSNPARVGYMKFIPFPVRVERLQELTTGGAYESAAEEGNIKLTCAFFGVLPSEIGFTADVNRATSEGQENITYRRGIKPLLSWLKTTLFDPTIQRDMGRPDLEWAWDYGESEDRLREAQIDAIYQPMGTVGAAELRTMRYPDLEGPPPAPPTPPALPAPGGDEVGKHLRGKHNQKAHGRGSAIRTAYQDTYRQARANGATVSDARTQGRAASSAARAGGGGPGETGPDPPAQAARAEAGGEPERAAEIAAAAPPPAAEPPPAPTFRNAAAADKHYRETAPVKSSDLSKSEEVAMRTYQGAAYQDINGALRSGNKADLKEYKAEIAGVDSVMRKSRTTEAAEVHRGMVVQKGSPSETMLASWKPGATFTDPAFVSTTVDKGVADNFTRSADPTARRVNVKVRVPPGTPAIYMNAALPSRGMVNFEKEREMLLDRGLTYRVVSRVDGKGKTDIVLEVVPIGA